MRWSDATAHYARAARLDPSYANLIKASDYAERSGDYEAAATFSKNLISAAETEYRPQTDLARALNEHAINIQAQGQYAEAEALNRQALEIDRATLGEAHPNYAIRLNNLAGVLQAQGKRAEAGPLYDDAVRIFEAALGPDHPSTQTVRANRDGFRAAGD